MITPPARHVITTRFLLDSRLADRAVSYLPTGTSERFKRLVENILILTFTVLMGLLATLGANLCLAVLARKLFDLFCHRF